MKKILKHLKNNAVIYLVLIACIVVICIAVFYKPKDTLAEVDTSLYTTVTLQQVVNFFKDDNPKFLVISTNDNQQTIEYTKHLNYSMADNDYSIYYLYQNRIDLKKDSELLDKLGEYLSDEYTYNNATKPLIDYVKEGIVPMTVLIKNKKVVYAFIGTMDTSALKTLVTVYGIAGSNSNA